MIYIYIYSITGLIIYCESIKGVLARLRLYSEDDREIEDSSTVAWPALLNSPFSY